MFRITVSCIGIDPSLGETAAREIQSEFRDRRRWHQDVSCRFEQGTLILCATNDFDKAGLALLDEFGDCLSAYLKEHGKVSVLSVETL
jgi:hypothetical protein